LTHLARKDTQAAGNELPDEIEELFQEIVTLIYYGLLAAAV
jgi:hypothetical protein